MHLRTVRRAAPLILILATLSFAHAGAAESLDATAQEHAGDVPQDGSTDSGDPGVAMAAQIDPQLAADLSFNPAQPDFTVTTLPTTLRLPQRRWAFRVTHRFGRPLGHGSFGSLVEDLFGLDSGGQIGLEFRYGPLPGTQLGIHRTSDRTIQFFGQRDIIQQGEQSPIAVNALVTIEGRNNFREEHSPAIGVVLSRAFNTAGAVYLTPIWVGNSNPFVEGPDHTFMLGLAARGRIRPTVYLVGEIAPRLAGFTPGDAHATFGIEKRAGGHSFQLNFSNSLATTMAPLARGGPDENDWFIGFNISRKFF